MEIVMAISSLVYRLRKSVELPPLLQLLTLPNNISVSVLVWYYKQYNQNARRQTPQYHLHHGR